MEDMIKDKEIVGILQEVFKPEKVPIKYRNELLQDLLVKAGAIMGDNKEYQKPYFKKPGLWFSLAAIIIIAILAYGIWLPFSVWDTLVT